MGDYSREVGGRCGGARGLGAGDWNCWCLMHMWQLRGKGHGGAGMTMPTPNQRSASHTLAKPFVRCPDKLHQHPTSTPQIYTTTLPPQRPIPSRASKHRRTHRHLAHARRRSFTPTASRPTAMSARVQPGGRPGGSRFAQFKLVLLGE